MPDDRARVELRCGPWGLAGKSGDTTWMGTEVREGSDGTGHQEKKDWDLGESTVGSTEGWRDSVGI